MDLEKNEFLEILKNQDDLGIVIRAHLHVESKLYGIIKKLIPDKKNFRKLELDYKQTVLLGIALGIEPRLKKPLLHLGEIRNRFAHNLNIVLDENGVKNFYKTFHHEDKKILQAAFKITKDKSNLDKKLTWKSFHCRNRFELMVVALYQALNVGLEQAPEIILKDPKF